MDNRERAAVFDVHRGVPDPQTRLDQHIELIDRQAQTIAALQARLERLESIDVARRVEALEDGTAALANVVARQQEHVDELDVAVRGPF